jgi:hypothetical protein
MKNSKIGRERAIENEQFDRRNEQNQQPLAAHEFEA